MHDIIDSGLWGSLSTTARTLFPVLCRFSNESFKCVWPGTEELLRLTGFKTKKSLQLAKKELVAAGLIDIISGNGRTPSKYYFKFDYKNSRVDLELYRESVLSLRGVKKYPAEGDNTSPQGGDNVSPNNINININTINNEKQDAFLKSIEDSLKEFLASVKNLDTRSYKQQIISNMLAKYGELETGEAIKIAIRRGKGGDIQYLEGILRNRSKETKSNLNSEQFKSHDTRKENAIISKLKNKFTDIDNQIEYQYYYNSVYYFKAISDILPEDIEIYAKQFGYNIKILFSNQSLNNVKPSIQFIRNI